jgi:hypothetical protein
MVRLRHYRTDRVSLGRSLVFIGVYGIAAAIMGIVFVLLLMMLIRSGLHPILRGAGLIAIPALYALYLFVGYRLFRLFGTMFQNGWK